MVDRHWDPTGRYEGALLHQYTYWTLELSWRQHTLGSFIIFCRREGVRLISQLTERELIEFKWVMTDIELALNSLDAFKPDHFNYWQMGNALPLLHFHGIPRYETERVFMGKVWKDETWGHPPAWTKAEASRELVTAIRDAVKPHLPVQ